MTADVIPFRRRGAAVTPLLAVASRPAPESLREELERLRAEPVTPVYCRHPDCFTVLSLPHPLQPGYLHDAVCPTHQDSSADRHPHGWGPEYDERSET